MLFNSLQFLLFFPILLLIYWLSSDKFRKPILLFASYFFYAAWDWRFLFLIIFSTTVDLFCGKKIESTKLGSQKKHYLILSLAVNLGILAFFKYYNFFIESFSDLFNIHKSFALNIILPVGISFFTFQSMSYTIDIYRGEEKAVKSPLDFFLFVAFFPQLVAGPIVRSVEFLPQLKLKKRFSWENINEGVSLFLKGLSKKVLFADNLARFIDPIFTNPQNSSAADSLLAIYAFAFQIYWDFSGYTDIATGIAKTFGYNLPPNFNLPYFSKSLKEFWRRWHISLSTWFRDYLYIGLGGNRGGVLKVSTTLLITMTLAGLWHGASWNFILWGVFHGLLLIFERVFKYIKFNRIRESYLFNIVQRIIVFNLVCFGWLLFRSDSLSTVKIMLSNIFQKSYSFEAVHIALIATLLIFSAWQILSLYVSKKHKFQSSYLKLRAILVGISVALAFIYSSESGSFLYFQF